MMLIMAIQMELKTPKATRIDANSHKMGTESAIRQWRPKAGSCERISSTARTPWVRAPERPAHLPMAARGPGHGRDIGGTRDARGTLGMLAGELATQANQTEDHHPPPFLSARGRAVEPRFVRTACTLPAHKSSAG